MFFFRFRLMAVTLMSVAALAGPTRAQERLFPYPGQSGVLKGGLTAIGGTNGGFQIARQDVDGNDATTDSSSEVMTLPAGSEVVYAALMWNQDCLLPCTMTGDYVIDTDRPDGGRATIVFADGSTSEVTSVATKAYGTVASSYTVVGRSAHADVTGLVKARIGGDVTSVRFAVGNIHPSITGGFRNATWSIFVVYRDPAAPLRALAIDFHASPLPAPDGATEGVLTIGGVQLPSVGPVTGDVIVFAADGQPSLSVEERIFIDVRDDDHALFNAANPDNGVWNHSISYRGVSSTTALPLPSTFSSGAAGADLDVFDITGKPTPGATETKLIATTTPAGGQSQEYVLLMTLGLSVDVQQPEIAMTKTVTAIRRADGTPDTDGIAYPGDLIDYEVTLENTGNDEARDIFLTDLASNSLTFVEGSLSVDDVADADASPVAGVALDALAVGESQVVTFTMVVGPAMVGQTLKNLARAEFVGTSDGGVRFTAESNETYTAFCGNALPEGEACDDGNAYDVDACRNDCSLNAGPEVCDDGFDNDADGLVDGWDVSDCGPPTPTCTVTAPIPEFTVRQAWASTRTFGAMQTLVAGDVDGDGLPEVIACSVTGTDYAYTSLVMVSRAGTSDASYTTLTLSDGDKANAGAAPAIGDVFLDVPGAEIMVMSLTGRLHVFSAAGAHLGVSAPIHPALPIRLEGDGVAAPNLADIDADGRPEIVLGNAILQVDDQGTSDPADDAIVVLLPLDITIPRGNGPQSEHVVLADFLSPADCEGDPICQGLEMAAGGTLYAIDLATPERRAIRRLSDIDPSLPTTIDGSTAVADVTGDGSLDIVFGDTRNGGVARDLFIWDPRLMQLHARFANAINTGACAGQTSGATRGMMGVIAITEVYDERADDDAPNLPEILFTTVNAVRAYNVNLGQVWALAHSDCSGATGLTAFDFNGDGVREIVINDETRLRIVYGGPAPFPAGVDASRNWAVFSPSGTATLTEHPIVVDVDADGQAEILTVTAATTKSLTGNLRIFESASDPWRPTRTTWNQMGYRVTAVNADLRIPTIMQDTLAQIPAGSGNRPLNNANTQSQVPQDLRLPPGILAAADIEITESTLVTGDAETGVSQCGSDTERFAIELAVRNVGDAPLLAGTPIAVYADDPFASDAPRLVGQDLTTALEVVAAGASGVITADFAAPDITASTYPLFVVINDAGVGPWPLSEGAGAGECQRDRGNLGSVTVTCNVCGNGIVELNEACDVLDDSPDARCCTAECELEADGASCDDGLFCTGVEACAAGTCVTSAIPCEGTEAICQEGPQRCYVPSCGNGILDEGEACDDGNRIDNDACGNGCTTTDLAEVCDDGVDNDGDGLVDSWDFADCGAATPQCTVATAIPAFTVREAWTSNETFGALQPVAVGDLDGDGFPEVIAASNTSQDYSFGTLAVISHAGTESVTIRTLTLSDGERANGGTAPAVGDVFLAVPGAEVLIMSSVGRLHIFSAAGDHLGASDAIATPMGDRSLGDGIAPPNIADIDQDGRPEIALGNAVLRIDDQGTPGAEDDTIVVAIPLDRGIPRGNGPIAEHVVLTDLLSPADCDGDPICQGLEMAAGGTIYALDVASGVRRVVRRLSDIDDSIPASIDGSTAVADVTGDGALDVVFGDTRDGGIARDLYIWDPRAMVLHARFTDAIKAGACGGNSTASTRGMLGIIAIAEVHDERVAPTDPNLPEILFGTVNAVRAYHATGGLRWELVNSDCSGATGVTAFDFNGDGIREIVINDEEQLRIIFGGPAPYPEGVDANRNWATFSPSGTATLSEHPVVVDVDADGSAEIVAITGAARASSTGPLRIFESASAPWRPTRTSWNQPGYRATAIGDDLRVPAVMLGSLIEVPPGSGNRPLNNANAQPRSPEDLALAPGTIAAADIEVVTSVLSSADETTGVSACGSESARFAITLGVRNVGDAPLAAGTALAVYDADPLTDAAAMRVGLDLTTSDEIIAAGETGTIVVDFPAPAATTTTYELFVVVNDDGTSALPLAGGPAVGECIRDSANLGSVIVTCNVCGNGVTEPNETCDSGDALGSTTCGCQLNCSFADGDASCDDENNCTSNDYCDGEGTCVSGPSPCPSGEGCAETDAGFQCTNCATDTECVESQGAPETCHAWACLETNRCGQVPTPGVACADDLFCNGNEVCTDDGSCGAGTNPCEDDDVCGEDDDSCTDPCGNGVVAEHEQCDAGEANGTTICGCQADCTYASSEVACSNDAACTVGERCDGMGTCGGGVSPCPSGETCVETSTSDRFLCANCAIDADCVASQEDASLCHGWSCNGVRRCEEVPTPGVSCADGLYCNGDETCDNTGSCTGSSPCSDDDVCDEGADTCTDPCGNGVVAGGEACDDGGLVDGDGCSATCTLEHGYCRPGSDGCVACPDEGPCPAAAPVCGDGRVAAGDSDGDEVPDEACDDGNDSDDDGCAACVVSCGFACTTAEPAAEQTAETPQTSACETTCGDGIAAGVEGCDDGGTSDSDGCSATCEVEAGWLCTSPADEESGCGAASVCALACGNGVRDGTEACDAGEDNGATPCGCQRDCTYADPDVGCDDGLACNGVDSCDGTGACLHGANPCGANACVEAEDGEEYSCIKCTADAECDDGNPCTRDQCVGGTCVLENTADACDDGTFCNGAGSCSDGVCTEPGSPCDAATEKCDETGRRCIARCGDGIVDEGEDCDGGDNCTPTCAIAFDTNGVVAQGSGCGSGEAGGLGAVLALIVLGAIGRSRRFGGRRGVLRLPS